MKRPYMATIYTVALNGDPADAVACASLHAARAQRATLLEGEGEVTRHRVPRMPIRNALCAAFNRAGYSTESTRVLPPKPTR